MILVSLYRPPNKHGNVVPCAVDGCRRSAECRGLCQMHYKRLRTTGDPEAVKPPSHVNLRHGAKAGKGTASDGRKRRAAAAYLEVHNARKR